MSDKFTGQSLLQLRYDTGLDLTSATVKKILYVKPDGTQGSWVATTNSTSLVYDLLATDIDQSGNWKLQTYVEIGGKKGYGDIIIENFKSNLSQ